jgi:hypothetical protein
VTYTRVLTNSTIGRAGHAAVAISDTTILQVGGFTGVEDLTIPVDPLELTVRPTPALPTFLNRPRAGLPGSGFDLPRHQAAVVSVPEDIAALGTLPFSAYAFFGADTATGLDTDTVFGYDPVLRGWRTVSTAVTGQAPMPRRGATAVFLRDCLQGGATPYCILVTGGSNAAVGTSIGTTFFLAFYPGSGSVTAVGNITYPAVGSGYLGPAAAAPAGPGGVAYASAISSVDGNRMFVFGGLSSNGNVVNKDIFEFSPAGFDDNNMAFFARETIASSFLRPRAVSSRLSNTSNPAFLNDGTATTCFSTSNITSAFSPVLTNPWVRIDLGLPTRITQIQYVMPAYGTFGILAGQHVGMRIFVSNGTDGRGFDSAGAVEIQNPFTDYIFNPSVVNVKGYLVAQYVWFVIPSSTDRILALCEAYVYRPRQWMWRQLSGFGNLALRKTATQSTMDVGSFNYGNPINAIDGQGSTTSRSSSRANSWLRVDLGAQYDIQYLTYIDGNGVAVPTANTGPCRSMNTEIAIGNNMDPWARGIKKCIGPANLNGYGTNNAIPFGSFAPWRIDCTGRARFVYVRKPAATMPTATTVPATDATCVYPCDRATLFRGVTCNPSAEAGIVVVREIGAWGSLLLNEPSPRMGAASTRWGRYLVAFGGQDAAGFIRNDLILFDTQARTWVDPALIPSIGTVPAGRSFATLTVLPSGSVSTPLVTGAYAPSNTLLLHAGVGSADILNDAFVITFPAAAALSTTNVGIDNSLTTCSAGGTACYFACVPWFNRVSSSLYIAQSYDGTWSLDMPVCVPNPSSMPLAPLSPSVIPSDQTVGALNFSWSTNPSVGVAGALTTIKVAPVDTMWEVRFGSMSVLDPSWTYIPPNNPTLAASYQIDDTDGSLALDEPPVGICNAGTRNCGILTRPFPTGIPGLSVSGSWSLETYVYFDMFSSKSPNAGQEIGIGLYDTTKPLFNCTGGPSVCVGALEFVAGMQRISATANGAGYASHNLPTGAALRWNQVSSTLYTDNSIGNSPWAWVRIDRDATNNRWRIGTKYYASAPWGWNTWLTDAQLFRSTNGSSVPSTMVFQPGSVRMAIYGLSTGTNRGYGKVQYIRWMPYNDCAEPGPVAFVPSTAVSPATSVTLAGLLPGVTRRYTVASGGPYGYSAPSAVFGPVTAPTTTATGGVSGWNSSELVNVARGRPTTSISVASLTVATITTTRPPSLAVDGIVRLDTTGDAATGGHTSPSFWKIDLGIISAVKEIAIYGSPTDANANLLTSFHVAVLPGTPGLGTTGAAEVRNGRYCEYSQLPDRIPSTSVYNNFTYAARFNCSYPQGLKGRYIAIMGMIGTALMFREVEVWTSNRCPTAWVPTNAQIVSGSNCAAGAPYGAVCAATCNSGFEPTSGSLTTNCNGDSWNDPPLVCSQACPPLEAPENAASCRQELVSATFANPAIAASRFYSLSEGDFSIGYSAFFRDGMLQIRARAGCTDGIAVVSNNVKASSWPGGFTLSTKVMTSDRAGVILKAQDRSTYYRIVLDVMTSLHYVERVFSSTVTNQVGLNTFRVMTGTRDLLPDVWYTLTVVGEADGTTNVYVNNILVMSYLDQQTFFGAPGFYAVSTGFFDDFTYSIDCGGGCDDANTGETCTFQCAPGLRPANPTNGLRTCTNGNWVPATFNNGGADMVCTLDAPLLEAVTLEVAENAVRNTIVGNPIVAISSSSDYPVNYAISWDSSGLGLFYIDSCSGQVKVKKGGPVFLDFETTRTYRVNVTASIVGFPSATTTTTMTVNLLNVDEVPSLNTTDIVLVENAPLGGLVGQLAFIDPENDAVAFSLDTDGASGLFSISSTGSITVNGTARAGLNFEANPTPYSMVVRLTQTKPTLPGVSPLTATGRFTITLADANDAPVLTGSPQVITITQAGIEACVAANTYPCSLGVSVVATDEDVAAFASTTTYATVAASILSNASTPDCAGAMLGSPFTAATTTGVAATGSALFSVDAATGALSLAAGPVSAVASMLPFAYGGSLVRAVYNLCTNVSDGFGGFTVSPATVVVVSSAVSTPVFFGIATPSSLVIATNGTDDVVFSGSSFGAVGTGLNPAAFMVNPVTGRRLNFTSCSVTTVNTEITCRAPTGSGTNYQVTLLLDQGGVSTPVLALNAVALSFAPPFVARITVSGISLPFKWGTNSRPILRLYGFNFSPQNASDQISFSYGPSMSDLRYVCVNAAVGFTAQVYFQCTLAPSTGSSLAWRFSVGGQVFDSPTDNSWNLGNTLPTVTRLGPASSGTVIAALDTAGGELISVNGSNFGPDEDFPLTNILGYTPPPQLVTASYGNLQFTRCRHVVGFEHTQLICTTAPGVGAARAVSVTVGDQTNLVPFGALAYARPVVTGVSGAGVKGATTVGGQLIVIDGRNFGPVIYGPGNQVDSVTYGKVSPYNLYSATNCKVVSDPPAGRIECLSAPGVGKGHVIALTLGAQSATPVTNASMTLSYAAPSVFSFSGPGAALADTAGSQQVLISGTNFGPNDVYTNSRVAVSYGVKLDNGPVPALTFYPALCALQGAGHTSLSCDTAPGAGRTLAWSVVVDGVASVQPTTDYAPPDVTGVTLLDKVTLNPVAAADVNGGTIAKLTGTNFGPVSYNGSGVPLLQSATYGLSGSDYAIAYGAWTVVSDTEVHFPLLPGSGKSLRFRLSVADQLSLTSLVAFDYASPSIDSLSPTNAGTDSPARSPTIITGAVFNLPVRDTRSRISVLFGPFPFTPTYPVTEQAIAAATLPNGAVNTYFSLPPSGAGRGIPVVYVVTSTVTGAELDRSPPAYFSYDDPVIDAVTVTRARFLPANMTPEEYGNLDAVECPFASGRFPAWDCESSTLTQITVTGANFASCSPVDGLCPSSGLSPDGVGKSLQFLSTAYNAPIFEQYGYGSIWCDMACEQVNSTVVLPGNIAATFAGVQLVYIQSWTHDRIVAYAKTTAASLRLELDSSITDTFAGYNPVTEVIRTFTQASPDIGAISGAVSDIPTTGGTAFFQIQVYNLVSGNDVEVFVGDRMATLVLSGCGSVPAAASIIASVSAQIATLPGGSPVTICAIPPAGQGSSAPVQVFSINTISLAREGSNTGFYVSYLPPVVDSIEVWDAGQAAFTQKVLPSFSKTPATTVTVPTDGSTTLRVYGTNLGVAPLVFMGDYKAAGGGLNATECPGTAGTHTCYQLRSAAGEGDGLQYPEDYGATSGFRIFLAADDQDSSQMYFSYRAPVVTAVTAAPGAALPTEGGTSVLVSGSNFGEQVGVRPATVVDVSFYVPGPNRDDIFCVNVVRLSHTLLNCTLPEGSGKNLSVAVTIANIVGGSDRVMSYDPPTLNTVTLIQASNMATLAGVIGGGGGWGGNGSSSSAINRAIANFFVPSTGSFFTTYAGTFANVTGPGISGGQPGAYSPSLLEGQTGGRDVIVLEGRNFGVLDADAHCVMFTWAFRGRDNTRAHVCDGYESFLGEGEVSSSSVIYWSHTLIVLYTPEGLGTKDVEVNVRGSMLVDSVPRLSASTVRFRYLAPVISSARIGFTGGCWNGRCTPAQANTEGGDAVVITGANFGPSPRNTSDVSKRLAGEANWGNLVRASEGSGLPTAVLVVTFHRGCLSLATDVSGLRLSYPFRPAYALQSSLDVCDTRIRRIQHGQVDFTSPAGVGANKEIHAYVVEDTSRFPELLAAFPALQATPAPTGVSQINSNYTVFNYRAPVISSFSPNIVYLTPEPSSIVGAGGWTTTDFDILGSQFGNEELADAQGWTVDERVVSGIAGGVSCLNMVRRRQQGATVVNCELPQGTARAGYQNFSIGIAGQVGYGAEHPTTTVNFDGTTAQYVPVLFVCANGYYGRVNETCRPCPAQSPNPVFTGATCPGYLSRVANFESRFSYPIPNPGFYNLNSSDAYTVASGWTEGMLGACPEGKQDNGRDVCIVPCDPPESCVGNNICAFGYTSKPPMFRCSSCDKGFYKRAGECIKCPDSPGALFVGFIVLIVFVCALGFQLNKKQVNIAVVSIGIDFFQVLAIFAQSRIKWPPVVKELLHVLSAFNLNIEIVAPECLIPDVSYKQKFWFIMLLPLSIGSLFGLFYYSLYWYKALVLGQPKKLRSAHAPAIVSSCLILLYMLYLYLTRTIFDVFNCTPTQPPDGYTYLSVVFERCGVPGGTQQVLLPFAVAGLVVYTAGYPIYMGYNLWKNREVVMEDQLLRAKGVGNDRLSGPRTFEFRTTFGRSYFQFKPDYFIWILAIILRKFFIALTAVIFNKNSSFQMAACLLVMFIAYAAQAHVRPYMSPAEYDDVIKAHMEASFTSNIHMRLRANLASVEARGKKKVRKNLLNFDGKVDRSAILGVLSGWLFNYNTVEEIMLFAAVIVCLMGIMYQANEVNTYYPESKDSVTAVVLIVIIGAIIYFVTVFVTEIVVLYNEDNRSKQLAAARKARSKSASGADAGADAKSGSGKGKLVADDGEINTGKMDTQMNPLFMNKDGGGASGLGNATGMDSILQSRAPPPTELWPLFVQGYADLQARLEQATQQLMESKRAAQLSETAGAGSPARGGGDADDGAPSSGPSAARKKAFAPTGANAGADLAVFRRTGSKNALKSMRGGAGNA